MASERLTPRRRSPKKALPSRVEQIVALERQADDLDKQSDDLRWEAARLIVEELEETKKTQRALAREIGKSHTHVSHMKRAWLLAQEYPDLRKERFQMLYHNPSAISAENGRVPETRRRDENAPVERAGGNQLSATSLAVNAHAFLCKLQLHWDDLGSRDNKEDRENVQSLLHEVDEIAAALRRWLSSRTSKASSRRRGSGKAA